MPIFFVIFVVVPLIEIYVLIKVGGVIGALPTVIAVVATAVIGVALLKQQGYQILFNARSKLAAGGVPATEVIEGLMLAIGGALLLTPGFLTDALGFSLLLPFSRALWLKIIRIRGVYQFTQSHQQGQRRPPHIDDHKHNKHGSARDHNTIDGEWRRED